MLYKKIVKYGILKDIARGNVFWFIYSEKSMDDKKQNKNGDDGSVQHVFEIRTMKSDNEKKSNAINLQSQKGSVPAEREVDRAIARGGSAKGEVANPFLSENDTSSQKTQIGSSAFAPNKPDQMPEKNNERIEDIAASLNADTFVEKDTDKTHGSRSLHMVMIAAIVIVVIGLVVFAVYMIRMRTTKDDQSTIATEPTVTTNEVVTETKKPMYATDIPNYFSFDTESTTVKADIAAHLQTIRTNFMAQDESKPISFIVTDKNDIPVSFHVFALSAGMGFAEDLISALEENFEIYAFNDPMAGVRFGFVIDIKNVVSLPQIIRDREPLLPQSFGPIMESGQMGADPVLFNDSSYGGQSIRYANLNKAETYSIDYTIINDRLIVGTSKATLRAIVDAVKSQTLHKEPSNEFTY